MKESELSEPVRRWLEGQGYTVHAEVMGCDLLARKAEELVVVELKTAFSLALVYQGIERQERSDSVYLAIGIQDARKPPPNFGPMKTLCRRLGLGLVTVRFLKRSTRVEVVLHPGDFLPRNRPSGRRAILREIDSRYSEFTRGGITTKDRRMSAYRQQALVCAHLMDQRGQSSPAALVKAGAPKKAGSILSRNVYGWFNKVAKGLYELSPEGRIALGSYAVEREVLAACVAETGMPAPESNGKNRPDV